MLKNNMRKWTGLIIGVIIYYIIHEGAHLVTALLFGAFKGIRFVKFGLGVQIVADTGIMSDMKIFIFCISGAAAALIAGYILVWQRMRILELPGKKLKTAAYYTTVILLFLDPLYLSVLYRFVGGGDFNGILLSGIPETAAVIFFIIIFLFNLFLFVRLVYPSYKQNFSEA